MQSAVASRPQTADFEPVTGGSSRFNPSTWRIAAMFLIAVGLGTAAMLSMKGPESVGGWPIATLEQVEEQILAADVEGTFVGQTITGPKVAFVFVGHDGEEPEFRSTAKLANKLCQSESLAHVQIGAIQSNVNGFAGKFATLLHDAEPIPMVTAGLKKHDEVESVNAATAFAAVRSWNPDQIMVVLAEPIQEDILAQARAEVLSWNAPSHFFATGMMLETDLKAYGRNFERQIIPLRPDLLADLSLQAGLVK